MTPIFANILGPDLLIVFGIIVLLFGSSQLPKLARSLGQASKEFRKGVDDGATDEADSDQTKKKD
jgi:sec-independent protein translocase protein TatA